MLDGCTATSIDLFVDDTGRKLDKSKQHRKNVVNIADPTSFWTLEGHLVRPQKNSFRMLSFVDNWTLTLSPVVAVVVVTLCISSLSICLNVIVNVCNICTYTVHCKSLTVRGENFKCAHIAPISMAYSPYQTGKRLRVYKVYLFRTLDM